MVEHDSASAGLIELPPQADYLLLDNITVDPAAQGRGIGRRLLAFAEIEVRRHGYPELRLYDDEKMSESLAICPALGWQETGRSVQDGYQRVFFSKPI